MCPLLHYRVLETGVARPDHMQGTSSPVPYLQQLPVPGAARKVLVWYNVVRRMGEGTQQRLASVQGKGFPLSPMGTPFQSWTIRSLSRTSYWVSQQNTSGRKFPQQSHRTSQPDQQPLKRTIAAVCAFSLNFSTSQTHFTQGLSETF